MVATGTQTVAAIRRVIVNALDDVEIETVPQPEPGPGEV